MVNSIVFQSLAILILCHFQSLMVLKLDGNEVGIEGVSVLAGAVRTHAVRFSLLSKKDSLNGLAS